MRKRWLCLFAENEIGILARVSGLLSGKSYNLESITLGTTEDETISRMTISLYCNDQVFEQIKKQLNRTVEIIEIIDYTDLPIHSKEIMYLKITRCTEGEKNEIFHFSQRHGIKILEFKKTTILLECVQNETENDKIIKLLRDRFDNKVKIIRGGSVAVEAL